MIAKVKKQNSILLIFGLILLAAFQISAQQVKLVGGKSSKAPLREFSEKLLSEIQKGEIDVNAPFSLSLETVLTADGRFDSNATKMVEIIGDAKIVETARQGLFALSESCILRPLKDAGVRNLKINVSQNETDLALSFESELPTEARAKSIESVINLALRALQNQVSQESDERILFERATVKSDKKNVALNLALSRDKFQEMIKKNLQRTETSEK